MKYISMMALACAALVGCGQSGSSNQNEEEATSTMSADTDATSGVEMSSAEDWSGTYEGTIPCADCPGIKTTVVLSPNETFRITSDYLDRDLKSDDNGRIMWHDNGSVAHLKGTDMNVKFKVGDDVLVQLDQEGKEITGELAEHYKLKKIGEAELLGN